MPTCEIRCTSCGKWFKSPIQFGDADTFFSSTLIRNRAQCQHCGRMTGCDKENMRFTTADGGIVKAGDRGFVGEKT